MAQGHEVQTHLYIWEKVGVRWDIKKKQEEEGEGKEEKREENINFGSANILKRICYTSHSSKLVHQIAKTELTYIICLYVCITKYFVHSLIRVCYYP